jgi:hypothetical protein
VLSRNKYLFFEVLLPLLFAGGIYLFFRSEDTVIFSIIDFIGLKPIMVSVRNQIDVSEFPQWFVYSLPGGLWLLAFQNILTWANKFKGKLIIPLVLTAYFMGIGLEFAQFLHITDGRFDWMDVLFYSSAMVLALSNVWLVQKKWQIYSVSEKSNKWLGGVFLLFTVLIYLADIV